MLNVVDLVRRGDEHRTINLPTVQALSEAGLIKELWLSHDSSTLAILDDSIDCKKIRISVSAHKIYRWVWSTILTIYILIYSIFNRVNIMFMSASPLHLLIISIFSILARKRISCFVYLHGELAYLGEASGLGRIIGKKSLDLVLRNVSRTSTKCIILTYPVYRKVCAIYGDPDNLAYIDFPALSEVTITEKMPNTRFRVGSFGVHGADKNSDLIYQLADILNGIDHKVAIDVVTIGAAHRGFDYDQHEAVSHLCRGSAETKLIPRGEFIDNVATLDLALLFYGGSTKSEFIASGVFHDCVNLRIPIAGLRSQYLSYYMERYGEIGFLADDLQGLATGLMEIEKNRGKIHRFRENMDKIALDLSYKNFKDVLLRTINEKNN